MKTNTHLCQRRRAAFTLIELLVVIAIISILAALVIPIVGAANAHKQISLAQTQLKALEVAIDGYKTKLGFYPPDNPNDPLVNPLYFELLGTTNNGLGNIPTLWVTMDGSAQIGTKTTPYNISALFGVVGFANTSTRSHSDDSGAAAVVFLNNLTPNQIGHYDTAVPEVKLLVCSVTWPADRTNLVAKGEMGLNPWRYNSSHPTNNTGSYDLWVDLIIRGKTNRICNWNTQPVKL